MRRFFNREQGYRPIDLLHAATDHLFSATVLFSSGDFFRVIGALDIDTEAPRCLDSAGYLSHLGIELTLKAFWLHHSGKFSDSHSLATIVRNLQKEGLELALSADHMATLRRLDQFYSLRYPQTAVSPAVGDLDWDAIHSLFSALGDQLPKELQRDLRNLDRTKKFGRILMRKMKDTRLFEGRMIVVETKK